MLCRARFVDLPAFPDGGERPECQLSHRGRPGGRNRHGRAHAHAHRQFSTLGRGCSWAGGGQQRARRLCPPSGGCPNGQVAGPESGPTAHRSTVPPGGAPVARPGQGLRRTEDGGELDPQRPPSCMPYPRASRPKDATFPSTGTSLQDDHLEVALEADRPVEVELGGGPPATVSTSGSRHAITVHRSL